METLPDYYTILSVPRIASQRTIKRAYRVAALRHHPDNCRGDSEQAHKRFAMIGEAYRVLSDPATRRRYDFRWQQYSAMLGDRRFHPDASGQQEEEMWWDDRDGPGFYRSVERDRDEIRILTISAVIGMVLAAGGLLFALEQADSAGQAGLLPDSVLLGTLAAQGLYLAIVLATAGIILLTRRTIRKILRLRYAAQLTGKSEVLPPCRRDDSVV